MTYKIFVFPLFFISTGLYAMNFEDDIESGYIKLEDNDDDIFVVKSEELNNNNAIVSHFDQLSSCLSTNKKYVFLTVVNLARNALSWGVFSDIYRYKNAKGLVPIALASLGFFVADSLFDAAELYISRHYEVKKRSIIIIRILTALVLAGVMVLPLTLR